VEQLVGVFCVVFENKEERKVMRKVFGPNGYFVGGCFPSKQIRNFPQ
jgi:hypothetical protein